MKYFNDSRDWFFEKRYGLFVHWGLYAISGFHEQEMFRKNTPRKQYEKYLHQFNPVDFDPERWLDIAQESGMEYIVFTTKHQDGFCLWNTEHTDFNIMNTPYKKDILKELSDACHRRGFPLLLYYSIVDNHHPNYPNRGQWHELLYPYEDDVPNTFEYVNYVKNQITELCTNYGQIHGFFWDSNHLDYFDEGVNNLIRKLQPSAVINGRGFDGGDYNTPEREYKENEIKSVRSFISPTEACQSIGMQSWGYRIDEDFYSTKYIMRCIDRTLAMGGNYLLNMGPNAKGVFEDTYVDLIGSIGDWFSRVKEAFHGTVPISDCVDDTNIFLTAKGNSAYVHFFNDPIGTSFEIKGLELLPEKAILLNDNRVLTAKRDQNARYWKQKMEFVTIKNIPVEEYLHEVIVIKLEFEVLPSFIRDAIANRAALVTPSKAKQANDY